MKVLLTKNVAGKGNAGDIIDVSPGYAQNFLYKQKLAEPATKNAVDMVQAKAKKKLKEKSKVVTVAKKYANKLQGKKLSIKAKVNDDGILYAAVNTKMIVAKIKELYQIEVSVSDISTTDDMKHIGSHKVTYSHKSGANTTFTVMIEAA